MSGDQAAPAAGAALDGLNDEQREAVLVMDHPLLVIAGAGSGKTRVITEKIRHAVASGIEPKHILAITFTNKAAGEMRHRVAGVGVEGAWVSTFHALCARLLYTEHKAAGLPEQFSIYDADDQRSVVRSILVELGLDGLFQPKDALFRIGRAKADGLCPDDLAGSGFLIDKQLAKVYAQYERSLAANRSVDFEDLLVRAVRLLRTDEAVRNKYRDRFRCVLVDEYQDTNHQQGELLKLLALGNPRLTATGDPDQSIYRWRGAKVENILRFGEDFPGAQVLKLERNYRSTRRILDTANQLIRHNTARYPKDLYTKGEEGERPQLHRLESGAEEAPAIAHLVARRFAEGVRRRDMAVFYRTNDQSRPIEQELLARGIPYDVRGGERFFERQEVKDLVAYLRFVANPEDSLSLMRIANRPTRGIGDGLKKRVADFAEDQGVSCWKAMLDGRLLGTLRRQDRASLESFAAMMSGVFAHAFAPPATVLEKVLDATRLVEAYAAMKGPEDENRVGNIQDFGKLVREFGEGNPGARLPQFLEHVALATEKSGKDAENQDKVLLMTLHAAKGLEFPCVFIAGLDEELLPHKRSLEPAPGASAADLEAAVEEERRLCYVGITRARRELHLFSARLRRGYTGRDKHYAPSRFLKEMEGFLVEGTGLPRPAAKRKPKLARSSKVPGGLRAGEPVRHAEHGKGVVLKVQGEGYEAVATVFFQAAGTRPVRLAKERLERL